MVGRGGERLESRVWFAFAYFTRVDPRATTEVRGADRRARRPEPDQSAAEHMHEDERRGAAQAAGGGRDLGAPRRALLGAAAMPGHAVVEYRKRNDAHGSRDDGRKATL